MELSREVKQHHFLWLRVTGGSGVVAAAVCSLLVATPHLVHRGADSYWSNRLLNPVKRPLGCVLTVCAVLMVTDCDITEETEISV